MIGPSDMDMRTEIIPVTHIHPASLNVQRIRSRLQKYIPLHSQQSGTPSCLILPGF